MSKRTVPFDTKHMYRVTIKALGKKTSAAPAVFDFEDPSSDAARAQLDALADYLYDLDLDFDVDMDGDMLIDDILMMASDGEAFETEIGDKKARYLVQAMN